MSRSVSGVYTLPNTHNPVVSRTVITTDWANDTLSDIATELTSSLDRSGRGAMTAPLQLPDGTAAAPALTFSAETSTGVYRSTTATLGLSTGGVNRALLDATKLQISGALYAASGAAGTPAFTFTSETSTGMYRAGSGDLRIAVGGTDKFTLTGSALTIAVATAMPNGSAIADAPTPLVVGGTGVAFQNSWAASGGIGPRYWKDALGIVHLRGRATRAATENTIAFTLPSGYRPPAEMRFSIIDDNGSVTFVTITAAGETYISSLGSGRIEYLDGIAFATF